MCHECPECGQMCYCDQDDTFMESGADECEHECGPEHADEYDDEYDEEDDEDGGWAINKDSSDSLWDDPQPAKPESTDG